MSDPMDAISSQSLRVLVIGRFSSIHTKRFTEELQRQGVTVAALWIGGGDKLPQVRLYHNPNNMRLLGLPRTASLGCMLYLRKAIKDFRPHIIHTHDDTRFPMWLSRVCPQNISKVYTSWGHNTHLYEDKKFCAGMRGTKLITSDAPDLVREISACCPHAATLIVRFGADDTLKPGQPDQTILAQYGLNASGPYILSPRSFRVPYNQISLIRALPAILKQYPDLKVIIKHHHVGNFSDAVPYEERVMAEAAQLGVAQNIIRINHIPYEHMQELYRVSKVAISIPLEDGFPATIFEAMACGCPLIVSDDESYEGVIENGVNALTVKPTSVDEISKAVLSVLSDSNFAKRLVQRAFVTVKKKGNFPSEIDRLIAVYKSIVKPGLLLSA